MENREIVLSGWKSIAEACGIQSVSTIRDIARRYVMPVKDINGKPFIVRDDLIDFIRRLPKKRL